MRARLGYLRWPKSVLALQVVLLAATFHYVGLFGFDASSETLVVENDPDLLQYERMADVFGGDSFLFLTFTPQSGQAVSVESIAALREIVASLRGVEGVANVFSLLDAPLLKSPPVTLAELLKQIPTLSTPGVDLRLARDELRTSPFFSELLITQDGRSTAIKIDLQSTALSAAQRQALIDRIRDVQAAFSDRGTLYLGGVPMIAADMVTFVKHDLALFGGMIIALIAFALWVFFKSLQWIIMPILTATVGVFLTVALLGAMGWQATVISSNFISLLGITTISLTIHLIVHYRELQYTQSELNHQQRVEKTMAAKFLPCLYTALTTIAAFGSLTVSGILPVEDFGWMMCIGIVVAFIATYTLFPSLLLVSGEIPAGSNLGRPNNFVRALGDFVRWRSGIVVGLGVLCAVYAYFGVTKVSLDNRFVDYFDESTEIYRGMRFIDEELGGTIPFEVILDFESFADSGLDSLGDDEFGVDDFGVGEFEFSDDAFATDGSSDGESAGGGLRATDARPADYWFTRSKLDELARVHRFVESKPFVGKVLSLTSLEDFALGFTDGQKLDNFEILGILSALPEGLRGQIIRPYANPETGQMRLSGRIIESGPAFDREAFRQEILAFVDNDADMVFVQGVSVTGMMVLFNTMLSQLLSSQLHTLVYILGIVFVMFLVLLRSIRYALVGMIPNSLASAMVIGSMGYAGIPLDMMTTTIAAICIGIGVDDTIHYLHRFREEYNRHSAPRVAISFAHESIGRALFYTSVTVVVGFSVLGLSNFVPTVMFGLWTAVAMVLALIANITLLPALLVLTHRDKPVNPKLRPEVAESTSPGSF